MTDLIRISKWGKNTTWSGSIPKAFVEIVSCTSMAFAILTGLENNEKQHKFSSLVMVIKEGNSGGEKHGGEIKRLTWDIFVHWAIMLKITGCIFQNVPVSILKNI